MYLAQIASTYKELAKRSFILKNRFDWLPRVFLRFTYLSFFNNKKMGHASFILSASTGIFSVLTGTNALYYITQGNKQS